MSRELMSFFSNYDFYTFGSKKSRLRAGLKDNSKPTRLKNSFYNYFFMSHGGGAEKCKKSVTYDLNGPFAFSSPNLQRLECAISNRYSNSAISSFYSVLFCPKKISSNYRVVFDV